MVTEYDKRFFKNYQEALEYFNHTGFVIKIVKHPNSLEKILQRGNVIKTIGIGKTYSPGRPSGNQQLYSQAPIFSHAAEHSYLFPIFVEDKDIEYMGVYRLKDYKKKMMSSGFHYFEFTFHKEFKCYTTVEVE